MIAKRLFATMVSSLLLFNTVSMTAFAEVALPDGAVKGLPERLTAMDSDGNVVSSDTGEYFFMQRICSTAQLILKMYSL